MATKSKISELFNEIGKLEEELEEALQTHSVRLRYELDGAKVRFEKSVADAHRQLKTGTVRWLLRSKLRNIVTAPVIYSMVIPFALLDISVSIYQLLCFPLYGIPRVDRRRYIVIDRHQLSYLNAVEKTNCLYCGYVNGLVAYVREIVGRTEQYWCPIKHAKRILDPHRHYAKFADFGNADNLSQHSAMMREQIRAVDENKRS